MTTPHQGAPDGAVTVGGSEWKYGQLVNEDRAREQFEIDPPSNLADAVQLLPTILHMIPDRGMKSWQKWLGSSDQDVKDGTIVQHIMDSLDKNPIHKLRNRLFHGLNGGTDNPDDDPTETDIYNAALGLNTGLTGTLDDSLDIIASGSNIVKNSGFERGVSTQATQAIFSNDFGYSGNSSLKMTSDGAGKTYQLLTKGTTPLSILALGGDVFYVEVMVRGATTNVQTTGGTQGIRFCLSPVTNTGTALTDQYVSLTSTTALNGTWTKLSGYMTMPANTHKVTLSLQLSTAVANGSIYYFDSVICRETTVARTAQDTADGAAANVSDIIESGSNIVKNSNFERGNAFTGGTFVTSPVYSGSGSLKLTSTGALLSYPLHSEGSTPKTAHAKEGDIFLLEVMVYGDATNTQTTGGVGGIKFSMLPYSRTGTMLTKQSVPFTSTTALNGVWTKLSGFVTMPTNSVKAYVYLELDTTCTSGSKYYFDQAVCREVTVATNAVDAIHQAVDGDAAPTLNAPSTVKGKLRSAWANLWDGLGGTAGATDKLPSDVKTKAASLKSLADTTNTVTGTNTTNLQTTVDAVAQAVDGTTGTGNAHATVKSKLQLAWANMWDGMNGTSGSTIKTPADVQNRAASIFTRTGATETVAGSATTNLQTTVDAVAQAVNGGAATGAAHATVKTNLQKAWGNIFDGMSGNAVNTTAAATPAQIHTASKAVKDTTRDTLDIIVQAVDGGATQNNTPATAKTKLQAAWGNIFDGMSGNAVNTTAVATPAQVHTASKAVKDTTRDTLDIIVQAVDGTTGVQNNTPATAKTKLQSIWNNLFDGLQGVSASGSALYPSTTYTQSSVYTGLTAANYTNMNNGVATGVDNATGTNASALEYVRADVGSSMLIDHIVIGYDYAAPFLPGGFGVTYTNGAAIEGSNDGTSWTSIGTAPTYATSGSSNGLVSVNVNASYRYIRVKAATYLALTEFQVWNAVTGSTGKTLTDVKSSAATFRSDHNTLIDNISTSWLGDTVVGSTVSQALTAMQNSRKDLEENTKAIQLLRSTKNAAASKGSMYSVDFGKFSDVTSAGFTLTYSGAGASTIVVNNGVAQWSVADSSARDAKLIYGSSTATDFQCVRGVMSAPPQVPSGTTPYFYAIARVSSDGLKYVFARAYCTTFGNYKADIGYTVNGAANEVIWVTGINLTWSLDMRFTAGVGTNARQYQIWSGDKVVYTHTESGTSSALCDLGHTTPSAHTSGCVKYRQWGAIAQVRNQRVAGKVSGCSASDNGTPAVNGSTARMHRASTTAALFTANAVTALPGSFFDTIPFESQDIDADTTNGTMKVAISKPYNIVGRVALSGNVTSVCTLLLQKSTNGGSTWTTVQWGDDVYASNGEAIRGNWLQYLNAGDMVRLAYNRGGITSTILVGESTGAQTFFAITGFDLDTSIG